MKTRSLVVTVCAVVILAAVAFLVNSRYCSRHSVQEDASAQSYTGGIDAWHAGRIDRLKKERGWLSLVALDWLKEGTNTEASLGTVTVKNGTISGAIDPAVHATLNGKIFTAGIVKTDGDKFGPDTLVVGTRAHIVLKRGERYALRIYDADAPARKQFAGIDRFPVSSRWRVEARWEQYAQPKKLSIETVIPGFYDKAEATGAAVFTVDGKEYRLEPTVENGGQEYFYVFGDNTNGAETYGAGRFVYGGPPKDGMIVIDFNKAYNPPCAFSEFATCPLPLPENRLPVRIDAGEKKYGHH